MSQSKSWRSKDYTGQIRNPLLRFLHAQAYGRKKLPIYAGVTERDQLLAEIRQRAGLVEENEPVRVTETTEMTERSGATG